MMKIGRLMWVVVGGLVLIGWAYVDKWTNKDPAAGVRVAVETGGKVISDGAGKAQEVVDGVKDYLVDTAQKTPEAAEIARRKEEADKAKALAAQPAASTLKVEVTVKGAEGTATVVASPSTNETTKQTEQNARPAGEISAFDAGKTASK